MAVGLPPREVEDCLGGVPRWLPDLLLPTARAGGGSLGGGGGRIPPLGALVWRPAAHHVFPLQVAVPLGLLLGWRRDLPRRLLRDNGGLLSFGPGNQTLPYPRLAPRAAPFAEPALPAPKPAVTLSASRRRTRLRLGGIGLHLLLLILSRGRRDRHPSGSQGGLRLAPRAPSCAVPALPAPETGTL